MFICRSPISISCCTVDSTCSFFKNNMFFCWEGGFEYTVSHLSSFDGLVISTSLGITAYQITRLIMPHIIVTIPGPGGGVPAEEVASRVI